MAGLVRQPAVAGSFYPGSPGELGATVDRLLAAVSVPANAPCPKALIVPHAGYVYSGPIAASAFARVKPFADRIERVVLVGGEPQPHDRLCVRLDLGDDRFIDFVGKAPAHARDPVAHVVRRRVGIAV